MSSSDSLVARSLRWFPLFGDGSTPPSHYLSPRLRSSLSLREDTSLIPNIYWTPTLHQTDLHKLFYLIFMAILSSRYYQTNVLGRKPETQRDWEFTQSNILLRSTSVMFWNRKHKTSTGNTWSLIMWPQLQTQDLGKERGPWAEAERSDFKEEGFEQGCHSSHDYHRQTSSAIWAQVTTDLN